MRLRVVILLIAQRSLIVAATVRSVAARVTVMRVRLGAAMIAALLATAMVPPHVANMLTQRLRNVVNSHRVLSALIVPVTMICRFSAQRASTQRHVVHAPSSRMTTVPSVVATSQQAQP